MRWRLKNKSQQDEFSSFISVRWRHGFRNCACFHKIQHVDVCVTIFCAFSVFECAYCFVRQVLHSLNKKE